MKFFILSKPCFLLLCLLVTLFGNAGPSSKTDILSLLPDEDEIVGLNPVGAPQGATGEDLYLLIDGGAEIYHEYGFQEVVFQTYGAGEVNTVNLEIFEMDSPASAYGIYTFKTGPHGKPVNIGQEGWLEDYYLNFWKGNYLITVIGLDTNRSVQDGIKKIARGVESKIKDQGKKPDLVNYLPPKNLKSDGITYLKGNLGLFNQYEFDKKNIFGLQEGIIAQYLNYSLFIFQYRNAQESEAFYDLAKIQLKNSDRFHSIIDLDEQFEMTDKKDNRITARQHQSWIIIILGDQNLDANKELNLLEAEFNQ